MPNLSSLFRGASDSLSEAGAKLLRSRRLMRAPIWLYRARLGFVLGSRILLLEHIGRKSGRIRRVALEVIDHPDPDTYVVASGFGTRAQWFKNLQADPHVKVSVGTRVSRPAMARTLSTSEADAALRRYVDRHRRAWKTMKPVLESTLGVPVETTNTALPMVELRLTAG
ncbi:nitroreductase family deazaflavin-dependent oxidoreductase [Mycolicibacterium sp. ND9-15]|uniref:nitroreductase family deazaflavin-dependent oxidoreductase n=1 Tax=Mycolicibacterium sp. ND9-15 TaxID=3042320 RepID=UPI002DDAFA60|nr:nitroreductase family deazaflavin-dependent oxidoreductase [Mycolicibacterium sp. ND9-15]WSE57854.1 nitroreductase family deazaflavin-dependent oxidoreductase [Mycolicibacterium sp. ND9-15]